jgi:hypothetical protein
MAKKKQREFSPQVQYRVGGDVEEQLRQFADQHECSVNEVARRLMWLALNNMGSEFYGLVDALSLTLPGNQTFVQACTYLVYHMDEQEQERKAAKKSPLTNADKLELAREIIARFGGKDALEDVDEVSKIALVRRR